jgi:ribosomal protein L29
MKNKDVQALHAKDTKALLTMQQELSLQLAKYRIEKKAGKLTNTTLVKTTADDLARVKTVLRVQATAAQKEITKTGTKKTAGKQPKKAQ